MTYATASQFAQQFGLNEAAALLHDEAGLLTPELLAEAIRGAFLPERTPEEKDAAQAALACLDNALSEAGKLMDGYFRSAVPLPITPEQIAAAPVESCCLELARSALMDDADNENETASRRVKFWRDWLRDIGAGRTKLVQEQQASQKSVRWGRIRSRFDRGHP